MTRAVGVDISYYDKSFHPTSFVEFGILRASYGGYYGGTWMDSKFVEFSSQSTQLPVRGAYHYMSSRSSWQSQADNFLKIIGDKRYDFFACDVEAYYNELGKNFITSACDWIDYIKGTTNKKVLLYTNLNIYNNYINLYAKERASRYPLWIAQYNYNYSNYLTAQPILPKGRADWVLWQFIPGEWDKFGYEAGAGRAGVDTNVFNGSLDDMKKYFSVTAPEPLPPAVSDPLEYKVIVNALNIRYAPTTTSNIVGHYVYGNTFRISGTEKDSYGNTWGKVRENTYIALKYNGLYYTTWRES